MRLIKNGDYHKEMPAWEDMPEGTLQARCMVCGAVYAASFQEYLNSSKNRGNVISNVDCEYCKYPRSVIFAPCYINESEPF